MQTQATGEDAPTDDDPATADAAPEPRLKPSPEEAAEANAQSAAAERAAAEAPASPNADAQADAAPSQPTTEPSAAAPTETTTAGTEQPAAATEPMITGPATILWGGFLAVMAILVLVFYLLARGRALRARKAAVQDNFFEPAGEDAEITFEGEQATPAAVVDAEFSDVENDDDLAEVIIDRSNAEPERVAFHDDPRAGENDLETDGDDAAGDRQTGDGQKSRMPFAGLFARKEKPAQEAAPETEEDRYDEPEPAAPASVDWPIGQSADESAAPAEEDDAAALAAEREAAHEREADLDRMRAESAARQLEEEEARRAALREEEYQQRLAEAGRAREQSIHNDLSALETSLTRTIHDRFADLEARLERTAASETGDAEGGAPSEELLRTLHAVEEALVAQSEHLQTETKHLLNSQMAKIDARLRDLSTLLESAASSQGGHEGSMLGLTGDARGAEISTTLEKLSARIDQVLSAPENLGALRGEIASLRRSLGERLSDVTAPRVQLADIVKNALAPNAYEFEASLPNNRRADCLVKLPFPPGPVAIDARFPVEAFHRLSGAAGDEREKHRAENEFRRTALRHIVDIAERMIIPGKTAESALMFIPSETMYAELHARFPDIIQDSYRARVWIVSPTTLMATLHTMRAVMRDASERIEAHADASAAQSEAQYVMGEVDELRRRVAALEENFDRTGGAAREVAPPATSQQRAPSAENSDAPPAKSGGLSEPTAAFSGISLRNENAFRNEEPAPAYNAPPPSDESWPGYGADKADEAQEERPSSSQQTSEKSETRTPFPLR